MPTIGAPPFGKGLRSCLCPRVRRSGLLLRSCAPQARTLRPTQFQCLWMPCWLVAGLSPPRKSQQSRDCVVFPRAFPGQSLTPSTQQASVLGCGRWDWGGRPVIIFSLLVRLCCWRAQDRLHLSAPCKVTWHRSSQTPKSHSGASCRLTSCPHLPVGGAARRQRVGMEGGDGEGPSCCFRFLTARGGGSSVATGTVTRGRGEGPAGTESWKSPQPQQPWRTGLWPWRDLPVPRPACYQLPRCSYGFTRSLAFLSSAPPPLRTSP